MKDQLPWDASKVIFGRVQQILLALTSKLFCVCASTRFTFRADIHVPTMDNAVSAPGTAFRNAERHKRMTYLELVTSPFMRLYTVATEIGGRQNRTATNLLLYASHDITRNFLL